MKKQLFTSLAIIAAMLCGTNPAEARPVLRTPLIESPFGGAYISALGGANFLNLEDVDFNKDLESIKTDLNTGFLVGGAMGYRFCGIPFRFEGEFTYRHNDLKDSNLPFDLDETLDIRFKTHTFTSMANVFYELDLDCAFTPFIGGGAGYTHAKNDAKIGNLTKELVDNGFAAQGIAGINFAFCDKTEIGLEYRYLHTFHNEDTANQSVNLNLRRFF